MEKRAAIIKLLLKGAERFEILDEKMEKEEYLLKGFYTNKELEKRKVKARKKLLFEIEKEIACFQNQEN